MDTFVQILEILALLATITGIPIAILAYLREQNKLRSEREYGTYNALDDKYIELQKLCLDYPDLDIFDTPFQEFTVLTEEQKKQEESILLIRISIFERAYLMYLNADTESKKNQWIGWKKEMEEWMKRKNFRDVWDKHGEYYDERFMHFFNSLGSKGQSRSSH